jgi:hypothetical protein
VLGIQTQTGQFFQRAEANLKRALARVGDCATAYREASDTGRRQFNLAFFERLLIDEDYTVRGELAPPFDVILGDELRRRAAIAKADEDNRAAVEEALRQRHHAQVVPRNEQRPQAMLVGADSPTTPYEVVGWSQINMVELGGPEPPTSWVRSNSAYPVTELVSPANANVVSRSPPNLRKLADLGSIRLGFGPRRAPWA